MPTGQDRSAARARAEAVRRAAVCGRPDTELPFRPDSRLESARRMRLYAAAHMRELDRSRFAEYADEGHERGVTYMAARGLYDGGADNALPVPGAYAYGFMAMPPAELEADLAGHAELLHETGCLPEHRARLYRTPHGILALETVGDRDAGLHRLAWTVYPPGGVQPPFTRLRFAPLGSTEALRLRREHYGLAEQIAELDIRDVRSIPGADLEALYGDREHCKDEIADCDEEGFELCRRFRDYMTGHDDGRPLPDRLEEVNYS